MTLSSLPTPFTADSGDSDDSEEDEEGGDRGTAAGSTWSGGVSRSGGGRGGRPGSRRKRGVPVECPFDREEILQIWARCTPRALFGMLLVVSNTSQHGRYSSCMTRWAWSWLL